MPNNDKFTLITLLIIGCIMSSIATRVYTNTNLTSISTELYEHDVNELSAKIDKLYTKLESQDKELKRYKATEKYILELGADEDTAKRIIKASGALSISPKS